MKKYWVVFKISWQKELEYRFNFLLGRLRSIVVLLLLYYLWYALTSATGTFAGYTQSELITYVLGANILRSIIFGTQSRLMATEINDGTFSIYLVKPVNHFLLVFFRELAQRSLYAVTAVVEVTIFAVLVHAHILYQVHWYWWVLSLLSAALAVVLYFLISYAMNLIAFWSREAMGPRFLFEWFLEFASGAYFPLDILSKLPFAFFARLPFLYVLYFPISVYLGRCTLGQVAAGVGMQLVWIGVGAYTAKRVWTRGLMRFTGEGI
jgi:ABC-2 type transport system permease protein